MIYDTLAFIQEEYNDFANTESGFFSSMYPLRLGNIAQHESAKNDDGVENLENSLVASLINVEEEHAAKDPRNYVVGGDGASLICPPIHLNLYLLFTANINDYSEALKSLSMIIKFFQANFSFSPTSNPNLPDGIEVLNFKMHPLSFDQAHQFWGALGGKYIPSVLYKARMISISDETPTGDRPLIRELGF